MTTRSGVARAGTRSSRLARWQTARVAELLKARAGLATDEIVIDTQGDRQLDQPLPEIGGKGVFTEALEQALRAGEIDFAVHSLKDLPIEATPGVVVAAVLLRADPRDVLISRFGALAQLPAGVTVGTSSLRREAQLRAARPDISIAPLRGNVDTRIGKVGGRYDAIVLAAAGVDRLGLAARITERLSFDVMLPAPGQGALAVQCRADDDTLCAALAALEDPVARATTDAERAFLSALGGGCAAPVAALGEVASGALRLRGLVAATNGTRVIRVERSGRASAARQLGADLARDAIGRGAAELLS